MTKNQINFEVIKIIQLWTFWTFLDILLKPPQPLMGLFLHINGNFGYSFAILTFDFLKLYTLVHISKLYISERNS